MVWRSERLYGPLLATRRLGLWWEDGWMTPVLSCVVQASADLSGISIKGWIPDSSVVPDNQVAMRIGTSYNRTDVLRAGTAFELLAECPLSSGDACEMTVATLREIRIQPDERWLGCHLYEIRGIPAS